MDESWTARAARIPMESANKNLDMAAFSSFQNYFTPFTLDSEVIATTFSTSESRIMETPA
jgi:hypothetical protein